MTISLLSHDLLQDFPELADKILALKRSDPRFASLFDRHGELDGQIIKAERGLASFDDLALEGMKKERLKLKDELCRMLKAS